MTLRNESLMVHNARHLGKTGYLRGCSLPSYIDATDKERHINIGKPFSSLFRELAESKELTSPAAQPTSDSTAREWPELL